VAGWATGRRSWQLAVSLIAAWRGTGGGEGGQGAVAQKLSEALAAAEGTAVAEQAVLGLTALGNMFIELYAASGREKIPVCGQLAPGVRSSEFPVRGHEISR
jgi:hypothetical protein